MTPENDEQIESEPRWPAALGVFAAAFLPFALPHQLRLLPPWILATLVILLVLGAYLARHRRNEVLNEGLGYAIVAILTIALLYGLARLIYTLPRHAVVAERLLESAAVLWITNVIVFACWYWRLDAGGPNARDSKVAHICGAFLFPQMTTPSPDGSGISIAKAEGWRPGFVDYLALSFYTCTAFSPTDVPVASRWAKLMMMVQAIISFTTVGLLAARAVNIL